MLTTDFITGIEELGFKTNKSFDSVRQVVFISKAGGRIAVVSVDREYECSTRWRAYGLLENSLRKNLYQLIQRYIETPLAQR